MECSVNAKHSENIKQSNKTLDNRAIGPIQYLFQ